MYYILVFFVFFVTPAHSHENHDSNESTAHVVPVAIEKNIVSIKVQGEKRVIASNGIPNHKTGAFPNRANPNAISAQSHFYRMTLNPRRNGKPTTKDGVMGVALNGIPFEPGTAECYGRERGERGPMHTCQWREEAIVNGKGQLGLDQSNAHVQPTGSYHYHGIPYGLLSVLPKGDLVHVGYAADGFKIMVSRSNSYKSSYFLKSGKRPSGPGGKYTGKYTADFEYRSGQGALDECNGTQVNGEYVYFVTKGFPFAPRCLMGTADPSFGRKKPSSNGGRKLHKKGSPPNHRTRPM